MSSPLSLLIQRRVGREFSFGGYQITRATTEPERLEAYRLRHQVFVGEGFIDPDHYPDGIFRDDFDSVSVHILVRDESGNLIGTTRFVRFSPLGFPTEHLFDFTPPAVDRRRLGEYGRLAILPSHRGGDRAPMLAMLKAVFECMIEDKTTHVYAFLSPLLAQSYANLGCVSVPLVEKTPSSQTLSNRMPMAGYFARQEVKPVLFNLRQMLAEVGVQVDRCDLGFVR